MTTVAEHARQHGLDPEKFRRWAKKNEVLVIGAADSATSKAAANAYLEARGEAPKYSPGDVVAAAERGRDRLGLQDVEQHEDVEDAA